MNKIIEKCDVCINGSVVSKELLIKTFSSFVSSTIEDKQHNVGIVLHTGSVCFDAILLSFAAISNVLYNETNATDIVQEITIRGWLDEESHTVRPQKLDSIQQIALIAGNDELFDSAEVCFDAGGQIYKIRRRILKAIGQAILGEVTGNSNATDSMTATVADRIKDAAVTLQIETITFVDDEVPVNTINRPITIDQ